MKPTMEQDIQVQCGKSWNKSWKFKCDTSPNTTYKFQSYKPWNTTYKFFCDTLYHTTIRCNETIREHNIQVLMFQGMENATQVDTPRNMTDKSNSTTHVTRHGSSNVTHHGT